MIDINTLFSKMESSLFYKNKYLIDSVCTIQNFIYKIDSKKFKPNKNKILIVGGYNQFYYLIKKLKKNRNNIVIKGSIYSGRSLFRKDINYCIKFKEDEQDIKEKIKNVDLIVVTNDVVPFEKKLIKIAKEYRIPTLSVQHGMFSGEDYLYKPVSTTKIAVWGEITKNWLLKNGEDKKKIEIVGAPMLDKYIARKVNKKEVKKSLNIPFDKKVLLFASQPSLDNFSKILGTKRLTPNKNTLFEEKKTIRRLLNVANDLDCFLIIKLHPLGKPRVNELENYIKNDKFKNYIILKKGNIQELISISNIIITHHSTTGLEGFYLEKPMICLNFYNKFEPIGYAKHGCAIEVKKEIELKKAINNILYNKNVQKNLIKNSKKFIKLYSYKNDGKSSLRLANLILRMIKESKSKRHLN